MLTRIHIRRFKRFDNVEIELAQPVVFIGPNNSGKTSALQALALWALGVRKWVERRKDTGATRRTGVTINRRELVNIPLLNTYSLWRALQVRQGNTPIRLEIIVEGIDEREGAWTCGLEFDTPDPENIRCRPLGTRDENTTPPTIPAAARAVEVAFLPPMSGLVTQEDLLQRGSIDRRLGEGRTADVLRNLCYRVYEENPGGWEKLKKAMVSLFGAALHDPAYDAETGILALAYEEEGRQFDLTASGQGFRQTLLLLAYLYNQPGAVLLLDEPDAHLEILRQRQIYQVVVEAARVQGSQVIMATHSEVILNEAGTRDLLIAFVGKPHKVAKKEAILRALGDYGFEHYVQGEQRGWVLYLEGATDLAILQAFARLLDHPAQEALAQPFVHYVTNLPGRVQEHFAALQEAFPALVGVAIFDRIEKNITPRPGLQMVMWERREIENYFALPETLMAYARAGLQPDLFGSAEITRRAELMQDLITQRIPPVALNDRSHRWWRDTKMSDDFLDELFEAYFNAIPWPLLLRKSHYYQLVDYLPADLIDAEVGAKLDLIVRTAESADVPAVPDAEA